MFGYPLLHWLLALVLAIVLALIVYYGLAFLAGLIGLAIPHILLVLIAVLVFLSVLFGGPRYYARRA